MDGSGSIGSPNFVSMRTFVANVVEFFDIGLDATRAGVVVYSSGVTTSISLKQYTTGSSLATAVKSLTYPSGGTDTAAGLNHVRTALFSSTGGVRPTSSAVPRVLVVITDGASNNGPGTLQAAAALRNEGVIIVSVGVGSGPRVSELQGMAGDSGAVYSLSDFSALSDFVNGLAALTCNEPAAVKVGRQTITTAHQDEFRYFRATCPALAGGVVIEEVDLEGSTRVFASGSARNPGPFANDRADVSNATKKVVVIHREEISDKDIFVAVQGASPGSARFRLDIWSDIFANVEANTTQIALSERTPIGTTVFAPAVVAPMVGNLQLSLVYELADTLGDSFAVDAATGVVATRRMLDREAVGGRLTLRLVGRDRTYTCLSGRLDLTLTIADVNDNAPTLDGIITEDGGTSDGSGSTAGDHVLSLPENSQVGPAVGVLAARDSDAGNNGTVTVHFSDNCPGLTATDYGNATATFALGASDHTLRLRRALNFEARTRYVLCLRLDDGGTPSLTTFATVRIEVTDVPEPPHFPVEQYSARVASGLAAGATLMQLGATSEDINAGAVVYTVVPGSGAAAEVVLLDAPNNILRLGVDVRHLLRMAVQQRRRRDGSGRHRTVQVPLDQALPAGPINFTLRATGSNGLSTDVALVLDVYHGCPPLPCEPWPPTLADGEACSSSTNASLAAPTCM